MSYEINLRFRRFSSGTGQLTGLSGYYISSTRPKDARWSTRSPTISLFGHQGLDLRPSARVPSPWTMTRSFVPRSTDLCEVQIKMFTPRAGSQKYPSYNVDVIYL